MADFTALKTAIQTYIKQNGNEEITGEKLQEILLSVVTTLGDSAINDLVTSLANEVAARQNADGTLQQNITNEATARGNADTALGGRIDDEATARANGDMALSNRLGSSITAENTAADQIGAEAEARAAADTALQELIDGITDNIENGYVYAGIATPSSTPASGKVFYLALTAGTYTNFGSTEVSQGINILKYNGSAWSLDAFIGIDDELTPGSNNIPKSGNVLENIIKNGSAFDLSAYNAEDGVLATYADLDAALAALNLLPAVYKQGGMSFKFVHTSDNKYVQYRLMSDTFNATPANWQGVDDEPTAGSDNLVKSGGVKNEIINVEGQITDLIPVQENESLIKKGFVIASVTRKWEADANAKYIIYPLKGSGTIKYTPVSGVSHALYLLSDYTTPVGGADANVVGTVSPGGTTYDTTVKYLYILLEYTTNRLPSSIIINGYDILLDLKENIDNRYNEREQTRMGLLLFGSSKVMEFDFTNKTCTIPNYGRVFFNSNQYTISSEDRVLDLTVDYTGSPVDNYSGGVIVYDIASGKCKVLKHSNNAYTFDYIVLATFVSAYKIVNTPNRYNQDGKALNISIGDNSITTAMLQDGVVTSEKLSVMYTVGILFSSNTSSKSLMSFDFSNKTCKIVGNCRIFARSAFQLANTQEVIIDISKDFNGNTLDFGGVIVWDITTSSYKVLAHTNNIVNNNQIVIATFNLNGNVNSPSSFSIDGELYGVVPATKFDIISPCFELIALPNGVSWWSDFITININGVDEMWLFTASSDETHTTSDGRIFRVRMSDWTLLGTITHNFGHCNTVHYDAVNDNLLIGNLPGNQTLPSALYIFYNVSSWASESTLDFTILTPTIVDVSSVISSQLAAFWAENGISNRNQVYIMTAYGYNSKIAKIVLGMGTNQLTDGTYDPSHSQSNQFNGTFDIIIDGIDIVYPNGTDDNKNVIQGGDYANGRVITANGHDQIYGFIWELQEDEYGRNSLRRIMINSVPRKADGTIDYSVGEGLCIKDGYVYHGLIKISNDFRETYSVEGCYIAKYKLPV